MAGASDKARFYLEQSIPELQELIRKEIFSKDEVSSIAKKRSGFEHKLNARGSTASDYARYAEYEMNLDSLRRTRAKRLGIKSTSYTGQRRIFFVLDRATRKFHGDTDLWLQYLTFARKQKANKRVAQIITSMLRLHPTSPELWIYAAKYAWDDRADITESRGYMQRGLRFCSHSKQLWSEYMKLEMIYLAKISARRQVLGLDSKPSQEAHVRDDEDLIMLPSVIMEDTDLDSSMADSARLQTPENRIASGPAFTGAIPIAIFDQAMKEFPDDSKFGAHLFDGVARFHELQCARKILQYIVQFLITVTPADAASLTCYIREPVVGAGATSIALPRALMEVLDRFDLAMQNTNTLKNSLEQTRTREAISRHTIKWIATYLRDPDLDPDIRAVLIQMLKTAWKQCLYSLNAGTMQSVDETISSLEILQLGELQELVQLGVASALRLWPDEPRLLALERQDMTFKQS
ncbi:MAG: hypothetical protein Q9166_000807 [cf. Caloplaca sp. 2 TL-2023]